MKQINYTGSSKLISRIVSLLNRKAPLPLDGNGDPDWGTVGQVLTTDGSGATSWGAGGGGGDSVSWTQTQLSGDKIAEIDINGTTTNVYSPSNPTVNDGTLTIQQNGSTLGTFTANQSGNTTVNLSGGGHTIEKADGTDMTARALLQFIGAYLQDDAGNDRTIANIVRTMTQAQFNNLSAAEKEGFIYVSDAAGQLTASEVALAAIAGMSATTVQSGVAELQSDKVEKSGDTMSGALTVKDVAESIIINRSNSSGWSGWLGFYNQSGLVGRLGVSAAKNPHFQDSGGEHRIALWDELLLNYAQPFRVANSSNSRIRFTFSGLTQYEAVTLVIFARTCSGIILAETSANGFSSLTRSLFIDGATYHLGTAYVPNNGFEFTVQTGQWSAVWGVWIHPHWGNATMTVTAEA